MRIQICFTVPNGINIKDTIAYKCFKILPKNDNIEISHIVASGASVGKNRNACILNGKPEFKIQKDLEFDYYLFVDSDIAFNYDHIMMLLYHNKRIISGNYPVKTGLGYANAGFWDTPGIIKTKALYTFPGVSRVNWCGSGFLMIKKSVLEEIPYPWFRPYIIEFDDMATCTSEDIGFCIYMEKHIVDIWYNFDCRLVHLPDYI